MAQKLLPGRIHCNAEGESRQKKLYKSKPKSTFADFAGAPQGYLLVCMVQNRLLVACMDSQWPIFLILRALLGGL